MIAAVWSPNIPAALLVLGLVFAMYVPDIVSGVRTYRRGRDLARRITQEHAARRFLDQQWKAQ